MLHLVKSLFRFLTHSLTNVRSLGLWRAVNTLLNSVIFPFVIADFFSILMLMYAYISINIVSYMLYGI
ncbi:TPA: hypothetical protein MH419_26615 [Klebsiella pneumoniae]|nr:hypothetical protein [Klebsiella pneumoniae]